jgi:hypothetical protein
MFGVWRLRSALPFDTPFSFSGYTINLNLQTSNAYACARHPDCKAVPALSTYQSVHYRKIPITLELQILHINISTKLGRSQKIVHLRKLALKSQTIL